MAGQCVEVTKPQSQTGLSDGSKSFTLWREEMPSLRSRSQSGQQDSRAVERSSADGDGAQPVEGGLGRRAGSPRIRGPTVRGGQDPAA